MLKNFLRIAFRTLTRNASIGILNILGLSAGMTAAILIFLWVQNETSFDNYHPNVDRIYRLTSHSNAAGWIWSTSPHPLAEAIHTTLPQVETVTSLAPGGRPVFRVNGELLTEKNVGYIDSNWFRVFHYDFISGSAAAFFHDPY